MKPFSFQQFDVYHEQCAQKIGTDAVLLGCWTGKSLSPLSILDVGAGSGVIGLILSQRFPNAKVTLLENHLPSLADCQKTLDQMPWKERINLLQEDFLKWEPTHTFDLVVSNPPFFTDSLLSADKASQTARHISLEQLEHWISKMLSLVSEQGRLSVILPADQKLSIEENSNCRKVWVRSFPGKKPVRKMVEIGRSHSNNSVEDLHIRLDPNTWHDEYLELTKGLLLITNNRVNKN